MKDIAQDISLSSDRAEKQTGERVEKESEKGEVVEKLKGLKRS